MNITCRPKRQVIIRGSVFFGRNQGGRLGLESQVGQVGQVGAETFQPSHQIDHLEFPPQIY